MIDNSPKHYLCIDAHAGTIARYERHPGKWGVRRLERAEMNPEAMVALGTPYMIAVLSRFRMTGKTE